MPAQIKSPIAMRLCRITGSKVHKAKTWALKPANKPAPAALMLISASADRAGVKTGGLMKKFKMPEYTKCLPDSASLNSNDVCAIFGYKASGVSVLIADGLIPQPDFKRSRMNDCRTKKLFWTVGSLRKLEAEQE